MLYTFKNPRIIFIVIYSWIHTNVKGPSTALDYIMEVIANLTTLIATLISYFLFCFSGSSDLLAWSKEIRPRVRVHTRRAPLAGLLQPDKCSCLFVSSHPHRHYCLQDSQHRPSSYPKNFRWASFPVSILIKWNPSNPKNELHFLKKKKKYETFWRVEQFQKEFWKKLIIQVMIYWLTY